MKKHYTIIYIIVTILAACLSASCRSARPVVVTPSRVELRHDTVLRTHVDTIMQRDSIYVERLTKGDTVFVTRDRWHTRYKVQLRRDTVLQSRVDTLIKTVAVPDAVPTKKRETLSDRITRTVAAVLSVVGLIAAIVAAGLLGPKLLKK